MGIFTAGGRKRLEKWLMGSFFPISHLTRGKMGWASAQGRDKMIVYMFISNSAFPGWRWKAAKRKWLSLTFRFAFFVHILISSWTGTGLGSEAENKTPKLTFLTMQEFYFTVSGKQLFLKSPDPLDEAKCKIWVWFLPGQYTLSEVVLSSYHYCSVWECLSDNLYLWLSNLSRFYELCFLVNIL